MYILAYLPSLVWHNTDVPTAYQPVSLFIQNVMSPCLHHCHMQTHIQNNQSKLTVDKLNIHGLNYSKA